MNKPKHFEPKEFKIQLFISFIMTNRSLKITGKILFSLSLILLFVNSVLYVIYGDYIYLKFVKVEIISLVFILIIYRSIK